MPPPQEIIDLVKHFERNAEDFRSGRYNETELRREFLDPFFSALGWDVDNSLRYSETYKDVVHEPTRETEQGTPDYCFRVGGAPKFYLEAKKPSVRIKNNPEPALQLRRYGWSSKLSLSILSTFDELAVYDCRISPKASDKASVARISLYGYREYLDSWDEISSRFSKEAVLQGSFDRFVLSSKLKKGTTEVDTAFLRDIEQWRKELASNIALRNPQLSQRDVNFAVQRTIDRIIFLRICEDRGLESYGQLRQLTENSGIYRQLLSLFRKADDRYNSGLFHFKSEKGREEEPDSVTPALQIDDARLKSILKRLYYPESPYAFSVVPADILGQVYEQFLGQVIRITSARQVRIEPKPDVRRAGGVYYTPKFIVDHIVKNTVGKLLDGKQIRQVSGLKILDPACGSGSFLIIAYQHLLDWYRDQYVKLGGDKFKTEIARDEVGNWRLTLMEKRRILLKHIFGVDVDNQAVEVTKLSLLLKVLEGETQLRLFHERALPDLGNNIKCGNSLISPDFYNSEALFNLNEDERYRINVFDWKDAFPDVMSSGGFDAVIGNPPYGASMSPPELDFLVGRFRIASKFPDSYCLFMVKALQLTRPGGFASYVVPNTFCDLENCDQFRHWVLAENSLRQIWQSGWAFKAAIVDTLVFLAQPGQGEAADSISITVGGETYLRSTASFLDQPLAKIDYRNRTEDLNFLRGVARHPQLGEIATVRAGAKLYEKGKGNPAQTEATLESRPFTTTSTCPLGWRPLLRGEDVHRYYLVRGREFINFGRWLAAPRDEQLFDSPKILMRRTDDRLMSSIDTKSSICVNSCHVIKFHSNGSSITYEYLVGLLNSALFQRMFALQNPQMIGKVFAEIKVVYVERLHVLVPASSSERKIQGQIEVLVARILKLTEFVHTLSASHARTVAEREIAGTEREIDRLVYEIYGVTQEN